MQRNLHAEFTLYVRTYWFLPLLLYSSMHKSVLSYSYFYLLLFSYCHI